MAAYQYIYVMKGLTKIYPGGRKVLENVWLSFLPGAKIGVLGHNGAGKSTLLKIMACHRRRLSRGISQRDRDVERALRLCLRRFVRRADDHQRCKQQRTTHRTIVRRWRAEVNVSGMTFWQCGVPGRVAGCDC